MYNKLDIIVFKILILILIVVMALNLYANWLNKDFQEETADSLETVEMVLKAQPSRTEFQESINQLNKAIESVQTTLDNESRK
jgi:uncharacterized protein YlxW (UPF0749 family)